MAGKFKWSYGDSSSVARKIREMDRATNELVPSVAHSISPAIEYLTGGNGYIDGAADWTMSGSTNTANNEAMDIGFDPKYDLEAKLKVPDSGKFVVTINSWLVSYVNAYVDGTQDITVFFRFGSFSNAWYSGNGDEPAFTSPQYGGCQLMQQVWGANNTNVLGINSSSSLLFHDVEPGANVSIRTHRYYWAYAMDRNGNKVSMPAKSWYEASQASLSMQITPVYANSNES